MCSFPTKAQNGHASERKGPLKHGDKAIYFRKILRNCERGPVAEKVKPLVKNSRDCVGDERSNRGRRDVVQTLLVIVKPYFITKILINTISLQIMLLLKVA